MNPASTHDQSAVLVTGVLLAIQALVLVWVFWVTLRPLYQQRQKVTAFAKELTKAKDVADVPRPRERLLARAWDRLVPSGTAALSNAEAVEPRDALAGDVLIPHAYNGRLDTAAPGVFTALGIVGTFLGLIIAFGHVDPTQSEQSIAPLVSGMQVAFWNSLVGVLLSIAWTVGSRWSRHAFDRACRMLLEAAEGCVSRETAGSQILRAFGALSERLDSVIAETRLGRLEAKSASDVLGQTLSAKLDAVAKATQSSSAELLATLVPQLEQSFKSLVDTPFENLSRTVEQYRQSVEQVAERHARVLEGLDASVAALGTAQTGLATATTDAERCVREFETFVARVSVEGERSTTLLVERCTAAAAALEAQTARAATLVGRASETATALTAGIGALQETASRQVEVATTLGHVTEALRTVSVDLSQSASTFGVAAARLDEGRDAAVVALGNAQTGLANAAAETARAVERFHEFVERVGTESERSAALLVERSAEAAAALEAQTARAVDLVARGGEAAQALATGVGALQEAATRQQEATTALGSTTAGLRVVSTDLGQISSTFGAAAARLEAAAGHIQRIGTDTAQDTARAAREELQAAVDQMSAALREFGVQNVAAFETSSRQVVEAVDGRMSDLTDRLSAELNTLTVRLPDVAESMTTAARSVRMQLERAVRGLDDAVRQLDVASRQSLKARLEEYDGAVAKAVDHFSGTLLVWDGKVGELSGAVRRLESAVVRRNPRGEGREEGAAEVTVTPVAPAVSEAALS